MLRFLPYLTFVNAVVVSSPALAADPDTPNCDETTTERRWYGGTLLALDGAGIGLQLAGTIGVATSTPGIAYAGLLPGSLLTIMSGPAVHFTHDRVGVGLASFGLRLALPFIGWVGGQYVGFAPAKEDSDHTEGRSQATGALLGLSAGFAVASLIDVAFLTYEDVPRTGFWITPTVQVAGDVKSLGVAGQF